MASSVGYTPHQAETRKHLVTKRVAQIEDDLAKLREIEPDVDLNRFVEGAWIALGEAVREIEHGLHETIDRRTRKD